MYYDHTFFFAAWNLTCHCGGESRLCTGDTDVCAKPTGEDPTGVCFVKITISEMRPVLVYEYACREYDDHFNSLRQECLAGPVVNDFFTMQCCDNEDGCNEHLSPPLPSFFETLTTTQDPTNTPAITKGGSGTGIQT